MSGEGRNIQVALSFRIRVSICATYEQHEQWLILALNENE